MKLFLSCWLAVISLVSSGASASIIFGGSRDAIPRPSAPTARPVPSSGLGSRCQDPRSRPGTCLPIKQCPALRPRLLLRDVAYLKASVCGKDGRVPLLCCPQSAPAVTTKKPPISGSSARFISPPHCGITSLVPPGRIIGGEPVQALGDLPWMTALLYKDVEPELQCGGAVINNRWILTAAHCVTKMGPVKVRVGDLRILSPTDDDFFNPPQEIEVETAFKHPDYLNRRSTPNKGIYHDVALLKLKKPMKMSNVVKPICIPEEPIPEPLPRSAVIAGWGLKQFGESKPSFDMLIASINISEPGFCPRTYRPSGVLINETVHICGNGNDHKNLPADCTPADFDQEHCQGGVDACGGDSGGPLMQFEVLEEKKFRVQAVGIISFAIGCGHPRFPGVYTRLDRYLDWLGETVANN